MIWLLDFSLLHPSRRFNNEIYCIIICYSSFPTASTMPLQIVEATSDSEFDEIIHCQWTSYETPHNGFFRLFSPINGTGRSARENSIRESKERRLQWHKADPTSHWVKVVDNDFDMVVGAAHWHIHKSDPFIKLSQRPLSAHWWPEGEARAYAEQALRMWMAPRRERMRRPHLRRPETITSLVYCADW